MGMSDGFNRVGGGTIWPKVWRGVVGAAAVFGAAGAIGARGGKGLFHKKGSRFPVKFTNKKTFRSTVPRNVFHVRNRAPYKRTGKSP